MRAHADQGDFHARGFFGGVLREFVVPFWRKAALAESRQTVASTR